MQIEMFEETEMAPLELLPVPGINECHTIIVHEGCFGHHKTTIGSNETIICHTCT